VKSIVLVACVMLLGVEGNVALQKQPAEARQDKKAVKEMPPGWKLRLDKADAKPEEFQFWTMPPGWHITTGPAGIVYDPAQVAKGEYQLESESFLFPPGEHKEGYGVFFAGRNLSDENQAYVYFLLRRDGRFLIKQRSGKETAELVPWTEHPAIVKHDGSDRTAKNVIAIEVSADTVDFIVNGQKVASLPRAKVPTDGVVGLRINHHVNVHVTNLAIQPGGGKG